MQEGIELLREACPILPIYLKPTMPGPRERDDDRSISVIFRVSYRLSVFLPVFSHRLPVSAQ